jgi:hypothetical protein
MIRIALIGVGAGLAAAMLFASVASGSILGIFLFYLAPLPILIASLGWSHVAGLIAAVCATAIVASVSGTIFLGVPVISFGAWWLGYVALLARPASQAEGAEGEWYPVGRLVLWAALIGTLVIVATIPSFGTDQESVQAGLRKTYARILRDQSVIDLLVIAAPPAAAAFSSLVNVLNLWLAARIVKISGRLPRPWPDLAALAIPRQTTGLLVLSLGGSFLPDLFGILCSVWAASLVMVFAILGFAFLHWATRGITLRVVLLGSLYAAAAVLGWPLLVIALLGVAENIFWLRARICRRRGWATLTHS